MLVSGLRRDVSDPAGDHGDVIIRFYRRVGEAARGRFVAGGGRHDTFAAFGGFRIRLVSG